METKEVSGRIAHDENGQNSSLGHTKQDPWSKGQDVVLQSETSTGLSVMLIVIIALAFIAIAIMLVFLAIVIIRRPKIMTEENDKEPIVGPKSARIITQTMGEDYRDPTVVTEWCPASNHEIDCQCIKDRHRSSLLNINVK